MARTSMLVVEHDGIDLLSEFIEYSTAVALNEIWLTLLNEIWKKKMVDFPHGEPRVRSRRTIKRRQMTMLKFVYICRRNATRLATL